MLIVWICSLLALGEMRIALKLFRSKLCIVGFDWIAAATVDSNHSHFQSPNIFWDIQKIFEFYQWDLFSPLLWPSIIVNYISSLYLYIEIDKSSSSWSIEPKNNLLMLNWKYPLIEFVSFVQLSPFFALAPLKVEKSAHMSAPSLSHQSSFLPISTKSRPTHLPHIPQTFPTRVFGGEATPGSSGSGFAEKLWRRNFLLKLPFTKLTTTTIFCPLDCWSWNMFFFKLFLLSDFSVNFWRFIQKNC